MRFDSEAYWAENIAKIEDEKVKYYENVGIYKLINVPFSDMEHFVIAHVTI